MFVIFSLSSNQREKQGKIFIPGVKMCKLNEGSVYCLSAFQRVNCESLTSNSPGKVNLSFNQRYPLVSVSVNQRVHCMFSEFFIVSVGMFTTLDVVADVLTLASDVVFLTVLKMHPDFTGCEKCILNFLFMSYSLHVTFKRSFSHVRKRNF